MDMPHGLGLIAVFEYDSLNNMYVGGSYIYLLKVGYWVCGIQQRWVGGPPGIPSPVDIR